MSSYRPRIVHLIEQLGTGGGAEGQVAMLARALESSGFWTEVIYYKEPPAGHDVSVRLGTPCLKIPGPESGRVRFLRRLRRELVEKQVDILHGWMTSANFYARLLRRLHQEPLIVCAERTSRKPAFIEWVESLLVEHAQHYVANSTLVQEYLTSRVQVPNALISVIPNGVDTRRFSPARDPITVRRALGIPGDSLVIGTVGRFIESKRHEWILDAASALCRRFPGLHVLMGGWGEREGEMKELVRSLDLERRVTFPGLRRDVEAVLQSMDVFLLTSTREGMPNAMLEAMSCGVPVVATRVGGVEEMLDAHAGEGAGGIVVGKHDFGSFLQSVQDLLGCAPKREGLGQRARARVLGALSSERMVARYIDFYQRIHDASRLPGMPSC